MSGSAGESSGPPGLGAISAATWGAVAKIAAHVAGAEQAFVVLGKGPMNVVGLHGAESAPAFVVAAARAACGSSSAASAADPDASSSPAPLVAHALPFHAEGRAIGAVVVVTRGPLDPVRRAGVDGIAEVMTVGLVEYTALASRVEAVIAEQRSKEDELAHGAEALREANERLRALISASPLAIYTVDASGLVSTWNLAAERMFGWSAAEAIGHPLPFVQVEKQDEFDDLRRRMLLGEHFSELLLSRRRRDGALLELSVSTAPLRDASGRPSQIMAIAADVTGRRHFEDQLRQSQKLEAIGRLAGGVAHDFNNLLAIVQSYAGLLRSSLGPTDPRIEHVDQIQGATDRAARVTRQLLAFGRKQVLSPVALELNAAVEAMATLLRRVLGADVEIVMDLAPDLDAVVADPTQLEQVILNLCLNARDAMPDGGVLRLTTRAEPAGVLADASVLLAVSDTGHGMDDATRQLVFEPFFTTKHGGRGTGLGLATVYGIVQQSSGQVRVESEPGKGATFRVYLPRTDERPAHALEPPRLEGKPGSAPPVAATRDDAHAPSESVLLVEDDALVRVVAARILREQGYVVIDAAGPREALALLADGTLRLDALVTDVMMPEMNGQRLARAVRALRPRLPVLYVSGYPDASFDLSGLGDGIAFLAKPFTPDALFGALRDLLDARRAEP